MRDKFIGFFRLIDACARPGCPICQCMLADTRHYLDGVLYEHVTDPATRGRLRDSWGFCNWHGWLLHEIPTSAFGSAILGEDLLRDAIRRFESPAAPRITGLLSRLSGFAARRAAPRLIDAFRGRSPCPACVHLASAEDRYVESALRFSGDAQFGSAYEHSQGLCVPHALLAVARATADRPAHPLLARTIPKWVELRRDLEGFISKHDHRNRRPCTEAEATAPVRAFEVLTGAHGLASRDLRDGNRSGHPTLRTGKRRRLTSEEPRADFERAGDDRATGAPEPPTEDAEDRTVLERAGEAQRAASERSEHIIAELRREVERLQAELAAAAATARPGSGRGSAREPTGGSGN
jgi:hypothetical protein